MGDRVLLVTADDLLARAVGALQTLGDQVTHARDGGTGVELAERVRPDVVIWDGDLRSSDGGSAVVARLLATGAGVVVVAAGDGLPAGIRALRDGAEQLVVRPVDPDLLAAAVARAAEAGRWRRAASEVHRPRTLAEVERDQIERALRHHAGNRTRAARELGISRATLINKIRAYALDL
ncbi:MAG TPA: helix-turn-helix domain-containing protein [Gemmatimonadales bacterium]|nr:helix-turn-helix domain-containing protein [Gemmatimonadales bacterium]